MKILLTGAPKVGKSTLLNEFRASYRMRMRGIICHALTDPDGKRVGFEAEKLSGEKRIFAHKTLM